MGGGIVGGTFGGGTFGEKTGRLLVAFLAPPVGVAGFSASLDSPSISAALRMRSSSERELRTLEDLSASVGGGGVAGRRLDFTGMFRGMVLDGGSGFWERVLILGSIRGIVRSEVGAVEEVVASLLEP